MFGACDRKSERVARMPRLQDSASNRIIATRAMDPVATSTRFQDDGVFF